MKWIQRKPKGKIRKTDSPIDIIAKIRGIEDVEDFLSPKEHHLHDPYLMKNIEEASNKIIHAVKSGLKIIVSSDPDADGITSMATMYRYLSRYTDNVDFIYGERSDGHGIAEMIKVNDLIEDCVKHGEDPATNERIQRGIRNTDKVRQADLLILLDSSTNDVDACKFVREVLDTDVIILDHHKVEVQNDYALLVNPQQEGCEYPNKHLSGAGVVFKTMQVMEDTLGEVDVWEFIDLVAVGMYSDMMNLKELENRYLIYTGMRNLKNTGLIRICKGAKIDTFGGITGDNIGFGIAPMLNGVARMDNIELAINILLEDDDAKCKPIRLKMQKINEAKREIQNDLIKEYSKSVDENQKILVVFDTMSSKGFNGIVSQQLTEKYNRPAIVGRLHNGLLSGSFRSINGFDLNTFFKDSGLFEEVGGHPQAGGIVIKEENIEELNQYIQNNMPDLKEKEAFIYYDIEIDVKEVPTYISAVEKFNKLAGTGFPRINVRVNGITMEERLVMGKKLDTVKFKTFDNMELIKFRVNERYAENLTYFDMIDAVGQLSMNVFYNFKTKTRTETPQLMINDYKER